MLTRSKRLREEQITNVVPLTNDVSQTLTRVGKLTKVEPPLTIPNMLEVNIDFDEAIREWRSNKRSIGNGQYKYICPVIIKGNCCGRSCYKSFECCWIHRNKTN